MKKTPRALFARRIVICEGVTEVGLLLGFRDPFCASNRGVRRQRGVAFADGEGAQAPQLAIALAALGYPVALYRDSDRPLTPDETRDVVAAGVVIFQYDGAMDTETALFTAASDAQVQALLDYARAEKTEESVAATLKGRDAELTPEMTSLAFNTWELFVTADGAALRATLAEVASKKNWFKELHSGAPSRPSHGRLSSKRPRRLSRGAYEHWGLGSMPEARILAELPVGSLIAPAGHGKTEAIAKTAALGIRTLVLTHTHAGVNALRSRLKRLGVPAAAANVDTIDGWCMRYVRALPAATRQRACPAEPNGARFGRTPSTC
jgi:hypothetical protein